MAKTLIVAGFGPGISTSVARNFGSQGYSVALLSRTAAKLEAGVKDLEAQGIKAAAYPTDLTDAKAVAASIAKASAELGPVGALFWNPYGQPVSSLEGEPEIFTANFLATVTGLVAAVQAAEADLEQTGGAVLVTGGGLSLENDGSTGVAVSWGADSLAVSKSAQRKLVHILHQRLGAKGVYAFEVTVLTAVKGTPFDDGKTTLTADAVAARFAEVLATRDPKVWWSAIGA